MRAHHLLLTLICATPAAAQRDGGSFVATATGATIGASVGLTLGVLLTPPTCGPENLGVGGSSGCSTGSQTAAMAVIGGATVLGATGGAIIGRRLTGGRQSVTPSIFGAMMGMAAGVVIAVHFQLEEPVPIGMAVSIPTGLMSSLVGW